MKIKNRQRFANTIIISLIIIDAILLGVVVICFAGSMVSLNYDSYFGFEYRKGTTWASEDQTIRLTYLEDLYYQGVIKNGEEEIEWIVLEKQEGKEPKEQFQDFADKVMQEIIKLK